MGAAFTLALIWHHPLAVLGLIALLVVLLIWLSLILPDFGASPARKRRAARREAERHPPQPAALLREPGTCPRDPAPVEPQRPALQKPGAAQPGETRAQRKARRARQKALLRRLRLERRAAQARVGGEEDRALRPS